MTKAADMVGRLRQSVAEIIASDAPDKDALLGKSFAEFGDALEKYSEEEQAALVQEMEQAEAEEADAIDPLLHFANAVGQADAIAGEMVEAGEVDEATAELLAQWSRLNDVVARSLVNHRVAAVEEDEDLDALKADGLGLFEIPLAKADGAPESVLFKTNLPEALVKFVTDPAELAEALAELGFGLAKSAGAPVEEMLEKFEEGQPPQAADPAMAAPQDPVEAMKAQVQVMMRLSAASLVQGQQILQGLGGDMPQDNAGVPPEEMAAQGAPADGAEEGAEGEEGDPAAGPPAKPGAEAGPPKGDAGPPKAEGGPPKAEGEAGPPKAEAGAEEGKKKPPFGKAEEIEDLQKAITAELEKAVAAATAPLRKQVEDAQAALNQLRSRPAAPKASLMAVEKGADGNGLQKNSGEDTLADLAKLSPERQAMELTKMVHRNGAPFGF